MQPTMIDAGWRFPPQVRHNGSIALATGAELVEQAMRIILLTYPGERQLRPDFGSRLRDHVFSPICVETQSRIAAEVRSSLARWETRADVEDVTVGAPGGAPVGVLDIDIRYRLKGSRDTHDLTIPFHTLPHEGPGEGTDRHGVAASQS